MAALTLEILEPTHQTNLVGNAASTVRLRGRSINPPVPLFYTWYTMPPATIATDGALNAAADNPLDFIKPFTIGSYAITFSGKDRSGNAIDQIKSVVHAGFTGGSEKPGITPCIIHILQATLLLPDPVAATVTISRANVVLKAKAPSLWDKPDYQKINTIQYRWRWVPLGNPAGRPTLDQVLPNPQLTFNPKDGTVGDQPSVTYQANLQNQLGIGNYTLTLRVENAKTPTIGHEISRSVMIT